MEQKYKKLSTYASENDVTYRTAWNRFKANKIKGAFMDETNHVKIPILQLNPLNKINNKINVATYARVSSNDKKKLLDEQLNNLNNFAISNGYIIKHSVKEIASGMNDNRKKLTKLLTEDDWNILIVENKDRLTRFGFNYIETLLNKLGKSIIIVNPSNNDKSDLMQDLISIIYSFSAKMYGLRHRKKRDDIIKFLNNNNN